jgi:hypothetical protein
MPHTDRILTTHVGSLIRPPKLIEFWRLIEDGKAYDEAAFEGCLTESVAEVVRQQADIGIDIVSDGEFSKGLNWAFYIFKRLNGIAVRPATPEELEDPMASMSGGQDRRAFPEFYAEYDAATGLGKRLGYRVVVNGPIFYSGHPVAAAVALEVQKIYAEIDIVSRAKKLGPVLQSTLGRLREHPLVGDVRGTGLILGMELMQDGEKRVPFDSAFKVGARVDASALRHGLILRVIGDRLVFAPPLVIESYDINEIGERLERALDDVARDLNEDGGR